MLALGLLKKVVGLERRSPAVTVVLVEPVVTEAPTLLRSPWLRLSLNRSPFRRDQEVACNPS